MPQAEAARAGTRATPAVHSARPAVQNAIRARGVSGPLRGAARGTSFDRFYVASPVCQSNRATLMTGRMPSLHGVRYNGISLSLATNTFVDLFRAAGWRTALIGKSHLQNMTGTPTVVEKPKLPAGYNPPPAGMDEAAKDDRLDPAYEQENGRAWDANPKRTFRLPYYGFDHVELCSGHAVEVHGTYTRWLRERRPDAESLRGPEKALSSSYVLPQAWRTSLPEELYPTSYVIDRTIAGPGGDLPVRLYRPSAALCQLSSDGVAEPSTIGMFSSRARITATSRA